MKLLMIFWKAMSIILIGCGLLAIPLAYAASQSSYVGNGGSVSTISSQYTKNESMTNMFGSTSESFDTRVNSTDIPTKTFVFSMTEKVRKGTVEEIDTEDKALAIRSGDMIVSIQYSSTTRIYLGNGEEVGLNEVAPHMKVYIFGQLRSDNSMMVASKIVIANKSKLERK